MKTLLRHFSRDRAGTIAITTALTLPLVAVSLMLGVDYGSLTLQRRQIQNFADLAAIAAAADISNPEKAAFDYFKLNNLNMAVRTSGGFLTDEGELGLTESKALELYGGYATLTKGHYSPDPAKSPQTRFVPDATPYNAVRVSVLEKGDLFFATNFTDPPVLSASGMASTDKLAAFSIGSRLASLNEGVLNGLLGSLLGTTLNLKAMDYQALADAQVNALEVLDALALDLGLQAGTYAQLLDTEISYGKLLNAIGATTGLTPSVSTLLKSVENAASRTKVTLKLKEILALGPLSQRLIGQDDNLSVDASIFDLVSAGATAGNSGKQLGFNLGGGIPGLASVKVSMTIGEPPIGTPGLAVGDPGSIIRTAQTRIAVEATVGGLAAIAGLKVRIPLYLEVAHAEARLAAITCSSGAPTVNIEAMPGDVELALGDVDTTAFTNFGKEPRVTRAELVSALLLNVSGMAYANATNTDLSKLTFSPTDIATGKVKSISTEHTLTTLTGSLLGNLDLRVELLSLPLILPKAVLSAVAETVKVATVPLDTLLYNLLLTLGVRIGEADIRVTGASCHNPVLVQ